MEFEYDPRIYGVHAALAPILWCLSLAWIIFTAENGPKSKWNLWYLEDSSHVPKFLDFLHNALEWKGFFVAAKLSYTLYLTQFIVLYYNVGMIRTSQYFSAVSSAVSCSLN